jgi:hypothetical protein
MEPKFDNYNVGYGSELLCPSCGGNYLRHGSVHIYDRREDSRTGVHIAVTGANVSMDGEMKANPSDRREGLLIEFHCEECKANPVLAISQHKGCTQVNFHS